MFGVNHDCMPITISGLPLSIRFLNSAFFPWMERQLTTMAVRFGVAFGFSLGGYGLACGGSVTIGELAAWGGSGLSCER